MRQAEFFKDFEKIANAKARYENGELNVYEGMNKEMFFKRFNRALFSLKDRYQHIISEAYLKDTYKFWWLDEFERATYYRNRARAVRTFLLIFNACI